MPLARNVVQEFEALALAAFADAAQTPDKATYFLSKGRVFRLASEVSRFPISTPVVLERVTAFSASLASEPGVVEALGAVQDAIANL